MEQTGKILSHSNLRW